MSLTAELWANWLYKRSIFTRMPVLVYFLFYLSGSLFWRASLIQWHWWEREVRTLPSLIILALSSFFIFSSHYQRLWKIVKFFTPCLGLIFAFFTFGYTYSAFQWQKIGYLTQFPTADLLIEGRLIEAKSGTEWAVLTQRCYSAKNGQLIRSINTKIFLKSPNFQNDIRLGDRILVKGKLQPFSGATNPGQFDYHNYQRYKGFSGQIEEAQVFFRSRPVFSLSCFIGNLRNNLLHLLAQELSQNSYPLIAALLTGTTIHLPDSYLKELRNLGVSHLLAVSGLHLGIVMVLVQKILVWLSIPQKSQPYLLVITIWFAVIFLGSPPSALRVGIFLTLTQLGRILQKTCSTIEQKINLLALTAWIILLQNPLLLFLQSFQLSFCVYLTILLFYQPIDQILRNMFCESNSLLSFLFVRIRNLLVLSFIAFLGSAPIVLFHNFKISLLGVLMNLWAVPLVGIILPVSLSALLLSSVQLPLHRVCFNLLNGLVELFNFGIRLFSNTFNSVWQPGRPCTSLIIFYYVVILVLLHQVRSSGLAFTKNLSENKKIKVFYLEILVISVLLLVLPFRIEGWEIVMLDVGQGDSIFMQLPGNQVILIDGGGSIGYNARIDERIILPFLLSRGITKIDLLVISHFDIDHVQGLIPLIKNFNVKNIWVPKNSHSVYATAVEQLARARNISLHHPTRGSVFNVGETKIECLHPESGGDYQSENDRSLVLSISSEEAKVLLTGDLSQGEEEDLSKLDIKTDILKVAHHGSQYSTSQIFLDKAKPIFALISVGKNYYGHPASKLLERLNINGCQIFRTDLLGAIQIICKDGQVYIQTRKKIVSNE